MHFLFRQAFREHFYGMMTISPTFTPTEDYTAGETYEALIASDALDAEEQSSETIQKAFTRNDALKILRFFLPMDRSFH